MVNASMVYSTKGQRATNQDCGLVGSGYALVGDGVGGRCHGDACSALASHVGARELAQGATAREAVEAACKAVCDFTRAAESPGSGCSLLAARYGGTAIEIAWVGSTAAYVVDNRKIECVAKPSSVKHGNSQRLLTAAGLPGTTIHEIEMKLACKSRILLCTDGVWNELPESSIARIVSEAPSPNHAAVDLCLGRHARDNATAIVLFT